MTMVHHISAHLLAFKLLQWVTKHTKKCDVPLQFPL